MVVFPAYAGMFPGGAVLEFERQGFPRIRGDVPFWSHWRMRTWTFSPHTRGCSVSSGWKVPTQAVFPAYAGMFRAGVFVGLDSVGFPRIRGDVPIWTTKSKRFWRFSPHTRGCSGRRHRKGFSGVVFPAYAGMFLKEAVAAAYVPRFPRIRGDVPGAPIWHPGRLRFSPHTRGCSPTRRP